MKKPDQKTKNYINPIHINSKICKLTYSDRKQICCSLGIGAREGEGGKDYKWGMGNT